jgi:hypothetical protein
MIYNNVSRLRKACKLSIFLFAAGTFLLCGCKKFVQIAPPAGTITGNSVFANDPSAISVLTDIIGSFNAAPFQGSTSNGSIGLFAGLSSDEYTLNKGVTNTTYITYYRNALTQTSSSISGSEHWNSLYNLVFRTNAAIEGLNSSSGLTPAVKKQLLGEAYFLRAFLYFYLTNEFGDVPLVTSTDPQVNSRLSRVPFANVYQQMISDLENAVGNLSENFIDGTVLYSSPERIRPTKWAVAALLARVYLYNKDYAKAESEATTVINQSALFQLLPNLNEVFLKNSKEAIWQIQPTALNFNTVEAKSLVIPPTGPVTANNTNPVILSKSWLTIFEPNDKRSVLGNWINRTIYNLSPTISDTIYYPFKYKLYTNDATITAASGTANMKEYFMVLRLAEQYLIRAEARAQLGNTSGALADLNAIRNRAMLDNYSGATDQASLLTAILHERQVELFTEWGHRWFDLKRTGKVDAVMTSVTPIKSNGAVTWQPYKQLYPLPLAEIQKDENLSQNDGY